MLPPRRGSKNSGGGIAPAAIGGLIEGWFCTVNAFRPPQNRKIRPEMAHKVLTRLNLLGGPGIGLKALRARQV